MASQSRKYRGFSTERVVAKYLSTWWPHADIGRGAGKDIDITYVTNASLVNDAIKQAIYRQAYHYYEFREEGSDANLLNEVKLLVNPYRRIVFP